MCAFAAMGGRSSAARYEAQKNGRLALPQSCTVVTCKSSGTYTAGGYAVNTRHEATLPGALMRLPCDAADGHTNNVSEGFPLLACLRACALTHN